MTSILFISLIILVLPFMHRLYGNAINLYRYLAAEDVADDTGESPKDTGPTKPIKQSRLAAFAL